MQHWSQAKITAFQDALLTWYDQEKRDLPWRQDHEPYHIWVSEIMLQQTQVQTVIPYYQRFMTTFPTVTALAAAPEDKLLRAWAGLGYYSRVRNMQKAAQQVVEDYQGVWPQTAAELEKLAGIGPYTAGAIASIAFNQPIPAIDGNAFRVFARLFEIDADIAKPQTRQIFYDVIEEVIATERPGDFNQAIMDLGSSYMTAKNPDSAHSPVRDFNQAYLDGKELDYPVKSKKPRPIAMDYFALVIKTPTGYLFEQRPSNGMLAELWTVPLIKWSELAEKPSELLLPDLVKLATNQFLTNTQIQLAPMLLGGRPVTHTFTHQKWLITLLYAELAQEPDLSYFPGRVVAPTDFIELAQPKVQLKIWQRYQQLGGH
ncbi:A/G-specific adenine glycosylase [Loigolactobacillus zhaoyuanensis]|uniref:A/G-specific adenine glycosylase n=1 Tax=Loigolactobacillus zhaoyuanensis TaxID=2486017 RepID=UPI000F73F67B|nr:A/G-specific adenine glycosylase [Loigolactobacillus zhaoyuanensis]